MTSSKTQQLNFYLEISQDNYNYHDHLFISSASVQKSTTKEKIQINNLAFLLKKGLKLKKREECKTFRIRGQIGQIFFFIYPVQNISKIKNPLKIKNNISEDEVIEHTKLYNKLSKREREIFKFIAVDSTQRQIAQELFISIHTFHQHRKHLYRKMGFKTKKDLINWYETWFFHCP